MPEKDISFLNEPKYDSYDTGYSSSSSDSSRFTCQEPEPKPLPQHNPTRKSRRSKAAFADVIHDHERGSQLERSSQFGRPSRLPPKRSSRHGRPPSRSRHRHPNPSPASAYAAIERPAKPRPPSPPHRSHRPQPPSNSTTQSKLAAGGRSKITPSEHSAFSVEHFHNYSAPHRRSFDEPFVQVSSMPPQSANPSAELSGASLARLSAHRAFSAVEMDTTRAAWHLASARLPASFEVPPAEVLLPLRSTPLATVLGPAFLSQVSRRARPPSVHRVTTSIRFDQPGPANTRHVSFEKANQYISPPVTMPASDSRFRATGSTDRFDVEFEWTAPWQIQPSFSRLDTRLAEYAAEVDEFGYTYLDPDGQSIGPDADAISGEAEASYTQPSLFSADHNVKMQGGRDESGELLDGTGVFMGGESPVEDPERDDFAREMRGWWHKSRP